MEKALYRTDSVSPISVLSSDLIGFPDVCTHDKRGLSVDSTNSPDLLSGHAYQGEFSSFHPVVTVVSPCILLRDLSGFFVYQVSIFLKDKVQNSNGRFVLPTSGPVPFGTQVPGTIR